MKTAAYNAARARQPCINFGAFFGFLQLGRANSKWSPASYQASRMSSGLRTKMLEIGKVHFDHRSPWSSREGPVCLVRDLSTRQDRRVGGRQCALPKALATLRVDIRLVLPGHPSALRVAAERRRSKMAVCIGYDTVFYAAGDLPLHPSRFNRAAWRRSMRCATAQCRLCVKSEDCWITSWPQPKTAFGARPRPDLRSRTPALAPCSTASMASLLLTPNR